MVAIANPLIPLAARAPSVFDAAEQGLQAKRDEVRFDAAVEDRERRIAGEDAAAQAESDEQRRQRTIQSVALASEQVLPLLDNVGDVPTALEFLENRRANLAQNQIDTSQTDELIKRIRSGDVNVAKLLMQESIRTARANDLLPGNATQASAKLGTQIPGVDAEGNPGVFVTTLNPTGDLSTSFQRAPAGVSFTNRQGETPGQQQQRSIETAGGTTEAQAAEKRASDLIVQGTEVADGMPTLKRAAELLQLVQTGGKFREVQLAAKRFFGVESADEGELSGILGKAVLSQLRDTFGAQFTKEEGDRLQDIEANFGKNNEANLRLINNAMQIVKRKAERAIRLLEERNRFEEADAIQDVLDASLTPIAAAPAEQGQPQVIRFNEQGIRIGQDR